VLWGEDDHMVPRAHGEAYAAGLPGCNGLEIIKGVGHAAHLEAPDEVAGLVRGFLS
jgi:pimeloyl-ACP methyl ester carboxylesterase